MTQNSLEQIMQKQGRNAAIAIVAEGKTVGLTCDNKRRSLHASEKDPTSEYFNQGRECYHIFTQALTEKLEDILSKRKITYHYVIPTWDEPINLFI